LHVVLADIQIKDSIDGIETAQMLQQLYHSHVIFLTSFSDEATLKRASSISITGYILKPFREEELIASLRLCALRIQETSAFIDIGQGYVYSIKHQQLYLNDVPVILAAKEQQLFYCCFTIAVKSFRSPTSTKSSGPIALSAIRREGN
ncbi:MAG TPA: hypothetical protein CFH80_01860, partial [Sulfurospirillum cavolei]